MMESIPTMDQWESMANFLLSMQRSLNWYIGDFVVNGEAQMGDDIYQAFDLGFSSSLIRRCAAVSREFPIGERNLNLSWTHHFLAMGLKKNVQATALTRAEMECWDTGQFRDYLRELSDG